MISAELSRRVAKARQSEVFLHDLTHDEYWNVLRELSTSNAQTIAELPSKIRDLIEQAESNPTMSDEVDYDAALVAAVFHLPGKHDQKRHGRSGSSRSGGRASTATITRNSDLSSAERVAAMKRAYAEGYTVDREIESGASNAEMALLTLADGTKVVRKISQAGRNNTRKEYLAGRIYNALGRDDVVTAQLNDNTIITTYLPGRTGTDVLDELSASQPNLRYLESEALLNREKERQARTPGGKEIAALDYLIENHDRHGLNWIVSSDDEVKPIDQGAAWFKPTYVFNMSGGRDMILPSSPFTDYWFGSTNPFEGIRIDEMKPRFTSADVARYRAGIEQIREEFNEDNDEDFWIDFVTQRLDLLEEKVQS